MKAQRTNLQPSSSSGLLLYARDPMQQTPPPRPRRQRRSLFASLSRRLAERRCFDGLASWLTFVRLQVRAKHRGGHQGTTTARSLHLKGDPRPIFLRPGTSDGPVLKEVFLWDEYGPLLKEVAGEVRTILDLGSNIGLTVRLWQSHFPRASVCAVEPDEGNCRMLALNALAQPLPPGGAPLVVKACIAGTAGMVALDRSGGEWGLTMRRDAGMPPGARVEAITMDQLLERFGHRVGEIDIVKCDIEGAEAEVFANAGGWLARVRHLAIELHAPYSHETFLTDVERAAPGRFRVTHRSGGFPNSLVFLKRTDA